MFILKRVGIFLFFFTTSQTLWCSDEPRHGLSIGTPGGINYTFKKDEYLFSIGKAGSDYHGIEAGYRFMKPGNGSFRSWNAVIGVSKYREPCFFGECEPTKYWRYIGVSATFEWGDTFIEPGISVGSGEANSPELLLEIGHYFW